jgi:heat shock protein HtpX
LAFAPALRPNGRGLANIFSTHPSLEKRIEELTKVQRQLGQTTPGLR